MNYKFFLALLLFSIINSPNLFAAEVDEENSVDEVKQLFLENSLPENICVNGKKNKFWELMSVMTDRGTLPENSPIEGKYKLRFSRYGCEMGRYGSLVIAPGRGEASIDYFETAIDFIELGYSPVYVLDHRGQGFSPRLLPPTNEKPLDFHKGHIGKFEDYINDTIQFVKFIENDLAENFSRTDEALFFTSNSMGGAIALGTFQKLGADNPFAAAALNGSQVIVNYISFLDKGILKSGFKSILRGYIKMAGRRQGDRVNFITGVRCDLLGQCEEYGAKPGEYVPKEFVKNNEAMMTHSRARYGLAKYFRTEVNWESLIESDYTSKNGQKENWFGVFVGGATNQWTRETSRFNSEMVKQENLTKLNSMPLRLITGERDLRAYREYTLLESAWRRAKGLPEVDLYHHNKLCDDINAISSQKLANQTGAISAVCDHKILAGGYHELYKESNHWRDQAIQLVHEHFQKAISKK